MSGNENRLVYDELKLVVTDEKFHLYPSVGPEMMLVIDRMTEEMNVVPTKLGIGAEERIYGLLGVIRLISSNHLIVVTERCRVGETAGQTIWKAVKTKFLPYSRTDTHLTTEQKSLNTEYVMLLSTVFAHNDFYFSYSYDLSHTVQRLYHLPPDSTPFHKRGEQKYIWNAYMLNPFPKDAAPFLLPIINGFVSISNCLVNGRPFTLTLISRRSKGRAGVRLFTRGIDASGDCANFVETEMIVETNKERASFVQTRGSMPFFWQQWPNLKYKPKPTIIQNENHLEAFNKHFETQVIEYGRQVLINLVDHKGSEGRLESFYKELVANSGNSNLKYEGFDFHAECSKMRWDRLSILINRISQDLEDMGFMLALNDGKVVSYQDGVFRSNCIDCLDRTNVVQSMIARRALEAILAKLKIINSGEGISAHPGLEMTFRNVWTDNADAVSQQYSGTGALKTDYTRTGVRTRPGMIQDFVRSAMRYYRNNMTHGAVQDGLDLFLGHYTVSPIEGHTAPSPLKPVKDWKYTIYPLVLCVAIAMFFANLITPLEYETSTLLYLIFWGAMIVFTISTIFFYGKDFVDLPKLVTKYPSVSARA